MKRVSILLCIKLLRMLKLMKVSTRIDWGRREPFRAGRGASAADPARPASCPSRAAQTPWS